MKEASSDAARIPLPTKLVLVGRIWATFLAIRRAVATEPLPDLAKRLAERPRRDDAAALGPRRLGQIIARVLRIGPWRARCLFLALVHYQFLRERGEPAELVIGMPEHPKDEDAHAWVELRGVDVGPPPGSTGHEPLARFS
jgi:transglutaminase-like putative cysteine protease